MKLYNADLSPFTGRVRMQIRAKGLENEIEIAARPELDLYKAITPIGKIPCLDTGEGFHLPESETIAEFIEDSFPTPSLRGQTPLSKAKVRLFARLTDIYVMGGMNLLFGQFSANPRDLARVEEGLKLLDDGLAHIEHYLEAGVYAVEDRLTLADCAMVPALFFCTTVPAAFGKTPFLGRAKVERYYERIVAEDPRCRRVVEEIGAALQEFLRPKAA